jgi:hypothetical protein
MPVSIYEVEKERGGGASYTGLKGVLSSFEVLCAVPAEILPGKRLEWRKFENGKNAMSFSLQP